MRSNGTTTEISVGNTGLPRLCILPPLHRQRLDTSDAGLRQIWNSGLPGRQEARFENNCARVPLWAVWKLLATDRIAPFWEYQDLSGQSRTVHAHDLLKAFVNDPSLPDSEEMGMDVIAVPNSFNEWAQDSVLTAWPGRGNVEKRLLWRPVAAVLGYADTLSKIQCKRLDCSSCVVVDVGPASVSATFLELTCDSVAGTPHLIPVRFLADDRHYFEKPLPPLDLILCEALIRHTGLPASSELLWHLFAGGSHDVYAPAGDGTTGGSDLLVPGPSGWRTLSLNTDDILTIRQEAVVTPGLTLWPAVAGAIDAAMGIPGTASGATAGCSLFDHILAIFDGPLWDCLASRPAFILVTGASLSLTAGKSRRIGQLLKSVYAKSSRKCKGVKFVVEGIEDCPTDLVRTGCALFGHRAARGLPTYYDHMRQLEILVQEDEEIVPAVLVHGGRVEGNHVYRGDPIEGIFLETGYQSAEFFLVQEGSDRLKCLRQDFQVRIDKRQPLMLEPSICPGQGHARVGVTNPELFGNRPVLLDWEKMADSGETVHSIAERTDRSHPPYIPDVTASTEQWKGFRSLVRAYLEFPLTVKDRERPLDPVLGHEFFVHLGSVTFDDADETGLGRRNIFGSGDTESRPSDEKLLERFLDRLAEDFAACRYENNRVRIVRAIAWTYQGERFVDTRRYLAERLTDDPDEVKPVELTACSQLFRTPAEFKLYFTAVLEVFGIRVTENMTNYIRNLWKLMTYRSDALRHIESWTCVEMIVCIGRVLEYENRNENFEDTSLLCILSILFLLRRRRFDPDFLRFDAETWEENRDVFISRQTLGAISRSVKVTRVAPEYIVYDLVGLACRTEDLLKSKIAANADTEQQHYAHRLKMVREISKFIQGRGKSGEIPWREVI